MTPRITTIKQLKAVSVHTKNSTLPERSRIGKDYNDKDTNGLTKAVLGFFKSYPCADAWRVNNMGVYDQKTGNYRTSASRKGISDITAIWRGRCLQIEIKFGKDKLSPAQIAHGQKVADAGGVFIIAKTFEQFTHTFWQWVDGKHKSPELFTAPGEVIEVGRVSFLDFLLDSVNDTKKKVCMPSTRKLMIELYNTITDVQHETK